MGTIFTQTRLRITLRYCQPGPGSSVGIATDYGLDDPGIESLLTLSDLYDFFRRVKRKMYQSRNRMRLVGNYLDVLEW
jgi:hypothetical protein